MNPTGMSPPSDPGPSAGRIARAIRWAPGMVLGVGLGAMLDGLIFHELLQWHHFISDVEGHGRQTVEDLNENLTADGLFHLFAVLVTTVGVVLLWRHGRAGTLPDGRLTIGSIVMGWGLFDIFDGVVVHLILSLHHLHQERNPIASDLVYVAANVVLVGIGAAIARSAPAR